MPIGPNLPGKRMVAARHSCQHSPEHGQQSSLGSDAVNQIKTLIAEQTCQDQQNPKILKQRYFPANRQVHNPDARVNQRGQRIIFKIYIERHEIAFGERIQMPEKKGIDDKRRSRDKANFPHATYCAPPDDVSTSANARPPRCRHSIRQHCSSLHPYETAEEMSKSRAQALKPLPL